MRTRLGTGVEDREVVMVSSAGESPEKWSVHCLVHGQAIKEHLPVGPTVPSFLRRHSISIENFATPVDGELERSHAEMLYN